MRDFESKSDPYMKPLLYLSLGALSLYLLDTLWQIVVGTPVPRPEPETLIPDSGYEFVISYVGGEDPNDTITPPWFCELFWN